MIPPVVNQDWLATHPDAVLADVRWYLDGRSGRDAYRAGHLPGAIFVDLDEALSAPASAEAGRHPLPEPADFAAAMGAAGIRPDSVVVAYDDAGGFSAGRLVWLLRLHGVSAALLDGGLTAWSGDLERGEPSATEPVTYPVREWPAELIATIDEVGSDRVVIDARPAARFRGEGGTGPDARAGHIPGALSAPMTDNLTAEQRFKSPDALRQRFAELGIDDASEVISSCGSGVTACHNLLAMEYSGLGRGRLYPGSWSQYAATDRPIELGD